MASLGAGDMGSCQQDLGMFSGMKLRVRSSKRNTRLVSFPSWFPEDTCVQKEGRQKCKLNPGAGSVPRDSHGLLRVMFSAFGLSPLWPPSGRLPHALWRAAYLRPPVVPARAAQEAGAFHFLVTIVLENSFLDLAPN